MNTWVFIAGILLLAAGILCLLVCEALRMTRQPPPRSVTETAEAVTIRQRARNRNLRPNEAMRIELSVWQRMEFSDCYDDEVLNTNFETPLQLDIFARVVRDCNSHPRVSINMWVPVYFAQVQLLLRFADTHRLEWLTEKLTQPAVWEDAS